MKRNLNSLIRKTINESQLMLEKKLPCDRSGKRGAKACWRCKHDYKDAHDAGNPSEPLYGIYGVCGGKVVDPSNDDGRDIRSSKFTESETRFDFEDELRINESNLLSERMDCWSRGRNNYGGCRIQGGTDSSSGCMSYTECQDSDEGPGRVSGRNTRCVRHNGNQSHGYQPGINRCLEWSGSKSSPVDRWEDEEEFGYSVSGSEQCCIEIGPDDGCIKYGPCDDSQSSESLSVEMSEQIKRIVREQAMMLGFGNTGGPGVGFDTAIATPTSKYEQYEEEEEEELDETSGSGEGGTYNINISNQSADPNYTADGMGMFESIIRRNLRKYKNR